MRSLLALLVLVSAAQAAVLRVPLQFPTIQAAVDAAQPGDHVVVSPGLYAESVSLAGKSQLVLRAAGVVRLDATGLGPALSLAGCSSVTVRGLRFVGADGVAVMIDSCTDVLVAQCRLQAGAGADSMQVVGGSGLRIQRCTFAGSQAEAALAVGLSGGPVQDLSVKGCLFAKPSQDAVQLDQVQGAVFERNVARRTGLCFVDVMGSVADVVLRDNRVQKPGDVAVFALGSGVTAEHNLVMSGSGSGLFLQGSGMIASDNIIGSVAAQGLLLFGSDGQALANRISGCGENGITCDGLHMTVSDNIVDGALSTGVQVTGTAQTVERNQISAAQLYGLYLNASGSGVHDNVVVGAGGFPMIAGMLVVGNGLSFSGNQVSGAGYDGLVLSGQQGQVANNSALGSVHDGFSLQGTGCVLTGNVAHDSGDLDLFELHVGANSIDESNDFGSSNAP